MPVAGDQPVFEPWAARILALAGDAIICVDERGRIFFFNRAAEALFGYRAEEVLGRRVEALLPGRIRRAYREHVRALASGTAARRPMAARCEVTGRRRGGGELPLEATLSYQRLGGRTVLIIGARDASDRLRARAAEELLVRELEHRVKNILAMVQALALQTLRASPSPEAFTEAFTERLAALSHIHALLLRSRWQGAALHELVREELTPFRSEDRGNIIIGGDAQVLEPEPALALSLALHELATNAAKHGALSAPGGRVEVSWRAEEGAAGRRLVLRWAELGGPEVHQPERRGFGSQLLERGIAGELGGAVELAFPPQGVRCRIELPLPPEPRPS